MFGFRCVEATERHPLGNIVRNGKEHLKDGQTWEASTWKRWWQDVAVHKTKKASNQEP